MSRAMSVGALPLGDCLSLGSARGSCGLSPLLWQVTFMELAPLIAQQRVEALSLPARKARAVERVILLNTLGLENLSWLQS
mmetsp:Transcript_25985/g.53917  ORF Transcript_25985/g.53917 Transcript_25985/m.53917 type:complete len:81 (+) Transcript_25985:310-552(+)